MSDDQSRRRGHRYGQAGSGLHSEQARAKFGNNVRSGSRGERYFAKLLSDHPIMSRYESYLSLRIPPIRGGKRYSGDVDIVIASGNKVVLLDVKNWAGGYVYWRLGNRVMRNFQPMPNSLSDPTPKAISQNMNLARSAYRANLPGAQVLAMVAFVPTGRGKLPASVLGLVWPGMIRSYLSGDAIRKILAFLGEPTEVTPEIRALLGRQVKN